MTPKEAFYIFELAHNNKIPFQASVTSEWLHEDDSTPDVRVSLSAFGRVVHTLDTFTEFEALYPAWKKAGLTKE